MAPAAPRPDVPPTRPASLESALPWWRRALRRNARHFTIKLLVISGFMCVFFVAYFQLLRNPVHEVVVMPLTALDHAVAFEPLALVAYLSLWLYVGIPAGMMTGARQFLRYGIWPALMCAAGLAIFYAVPTAVPAGLQPDVSTQYSAFALLRGIDAAGNACPSLHVAGAVFSAAWVHRLIRPLGAPPWALAANALWCVLIVWSTMAVKQHVALDVAAGTLLALLFLLPSWRWGPDMAVHLASETAS